MASGAKDEVGAPAPVPEGAAGAARAPETPSTAAPAISPAKFRAADQIVEILIQAGVRTIFGLPGGAIAPVYDALLDHPEIRVVTCKHETMAVFAAAAYARATDGIGVVLVTSGPGVTNAITGIASAYCDSLPVLVLAGEVPRSQFGRGALQEGGPYTLDLRGMMHTITKASYELTTAKSTAAVLGKAIATARSGRRGPVFVQLPVDVTREAVSPPVMGAQVTAQFALEGALLDEVADLLANAERPLLVAGSGVRWGRGPEQLLRLAERGGIPVATTPKAKGVFPESHPLALGIYGHGGHASARSYLDAGVDVLFAVGTGFGEQATNSWNQTIKASRSFLQLDIDAAQIGRNYRADIGLVGPAEVILARLLERVPKSRRLISVKGVQRQLDPELLAQPGPIKPQRALWEIQQVMPEDTIYSVDIGDHMFFALHYLHLDGPDCFFLSGLASMGSSIGAAIGAKLALPKRPVVCICGDGTLTMAGMEMLTAVQDELPILFAVVNNGCYGMVERGLQQIFGRTAAFSSAPLSVAALAQSLGLQAATVREPGDILKLAGTFPSKQAMLLDIQVNGLEPAPGSDQRFTSIKRGGTA